MSVIFKRKSHQNRASVISPRGVSTHHCLSSGTCESMRSAPARFACNNISELHKGTLLTIINYYRNNRQTSLVDSVTLSLDL